MKEKFDRQKVLGFVNKVIETARCPICGNNNFSLIDGFFSHFVNENLDIKVKTESFVPSVATYCINCGFMNFHVWGLIENKIEAEQAKLRNVSDFTDPRDGKVYKTVVIGEQTWFAENLNYNIEGSVRYGKDSNNIKKYGRYYDWKMISEACPPGWHLPNTNDWQKLVDFCGGDEFAGEKLRLENGWGDNAGTNEFGFAALANGYLSVAHNQFGYLGKRALWWTSEEYKPDPEKGYVQCIDGKKCYKYEEFKINMFPIRCIKNS